MGHSSKQFRGILTPARPPSNFFSFLFVFSTVENKFTEIYVRKLSAVAINLHFHVAPRPLMRLRSWETMENFETFSWDSSKHRRKWKDCEKQVHMIKASSGKDFEVCAHN